MTRELIALRRIIRDPDRDVILTITVMLGLIVDPSLLRSEQVTATVPRASGAGFG